MSVGIVKCVVCGLGRRKAYDLPAGAKIYGCVRLVVKGIERWLCADCVRAAGCEWARTAKQAPDSDEIA